MYPRLRAARWSYLASSVLALLSLAACQKMDKPEVAAANAHVAMATLSPAALPAAVAAGLNFTALPGGLWLVQTESSLQLRDAESLLAEQALSGERLDSRVLSATTALAVVQDRAGALYRLDVDVTARQLALQRLPAPDFAVEGFCLQQAKEGVSVWLLGDEGRGEQWLLASGGVRSVRQLALPPGSEFCSVDDDAGLVYINEPGTGLWAYTAAIESDTARRAVAMLKPFGQLEKSVGNMVALPGGVLVLDPEAAEASVYRRVANDWQVAERLSLPAFKEAEAISRRLSPARAEIFLRDDEGRDWRRVVLALPAAAAAKTSGQGLPEVLASAQTDPVAGLGDAADDPAIWINAAAPEKSRLLGTNKKEGLLVYDLSGRERQKLPVGRLNNVDVRQGVVLAGQRLDLAVATHRDENALAFFRIDADGQVSELGRIPTPFKEIYGLCLYQPSADALQVFVNDKSGEFLQFQVGLSGKALSGKVLRRFHTRSQPEGCVADDKNQRLFFGEEDHGIWTISAAADGGSTPRLVMATGEQLVADVEGMAIYHGARASYLVVSSQGNDSYVVLDALPPHAYRGAFRIGLNAAVGIDGVSETDGLDVSAVALGSRYPHGLLVVQDGRKRLPQGPQNFKLVSWTQIAEALQLP